MLFGFRRQEAIPRMVEEWIKETLIGAGRVGVGQYPNPPWVFLNNSQTRLFKFNPVPLGTGRGGYPKKPAPLPSLVMNSFLPHVRGALRMCKAFTYVGHSFFAFIFH